MTTHEQVMLVHPNGNCILVDTGMAELLHLMWERGYDTNFSCQGKVMFKDQTVWSNRLHRAYISMPRTKKNFDLVQKIMAGFYAFYNNSKILWHIEFDKHRDQGVRIVLRFPNSDIPKLVTFITNLS